MRHTKLPCGCVYEHGRERWTSLCSGHQAESDELRARWSAELAARRAAEIPPAPSQQRYGCDYCSASFATVSERIAHTRTHPGTIHSAGVS